MSTLHSRMVNAVRISSPYIIASVTKDRHHSVTKESLASKWMVILKSATDTIKFTTQKVMRIATGPLMRKYKPKIAPFGKYRQLKAIFYKNPLYVKVPSLLGNKLDQVFTSGDFIFVSPMKSKADGGDGLPQKPQISSFFYSLSI